LRDVQRVGGSLKTAAIGNGNERLHTEGIDFHKKYEGIGIINSFYSDTGSAQNERVDEDVKRG